ncbi:TetR/AcrR family transcriptional regulator [Mycobacterium spongiae]|uniref:TetR family transcriptional regulator n=1 Tax=Mycobacterium spongiae TaxID=886343 RepID=A0A975JVI7_9MYCO|nr:TetR/AcrR family transcriptional regulator [Mycobacterium spongiae]QUR65899.1 TetR family transcriptional regulator [Mycobacterium spongiae]
MSITASRGPGRPPAAKADETRKRIVRAARQVFSERGYDGATFQEIALRADLTRPAINHYFASKQLLYGAVVDRTNELVVLAGIERARTEVTLMARLAAFLAVALEADIQNPSTAAFLATEVMEAHRHPELNRGDNDAVQISREFLRWAVAEAIAREELAPDTDPGPLVETLLLVLCGVGFYAGFVGSHREMEKILATVGQALAGILWRPGG